jgi:RNAse (barnase) inhibitor barstar
MNTMDHTTPSELHKEAPLKRVKANIVQSIRAHGAEELQLAASQLGHHFLYANLGATQSKQDVLDGIAAQFTLPAHFGKNFDALYDCLTDPLYKAGQQVGFIVVIEHIPVTSKFDKETREQLLDIFRDAADYWHDRKVAFRCFYSFSVARTAGDAGLSKDGQELEGFDEPMPTDKLVDVSPLALRMSSPFNAGYWLAAS